MRGIGIKPKKIIPPGGWGWARTRGVLYLSWEAFRFHLRVISLRGQRGREGRGGLNLSYWPFLLLGESSFPAHRAGLSMNTYLPVRASLQHKLVSGQNGNTLKKVAFSKAFLASGISLSHTHVREHTHTHPATGSPGFPDPA